MPPKVMTKCKPIEACTATLMDTCNADGDDEGDVCESTEEKQELEHILLRMQRK